MGGCNTVLHCHAMFIKMEQEAEKKIRVRVKQLNSFRRQLFRNLLLFELTLLAIHLNVEWGSEFYRNNNYERESFFCSRAYFAEQCSYGIRIICKSKYDQRIK